MTSILALTALVYEHHPQQRDPVSGCIYSYNLHGTVIFLTREEFDALHVFETLGVSSVLVFLTTVFIMQRQQLRVHDRKYVRPKPGSES